ncbi:MAG: hypothetical protein CL886_10350 [Dehalococcoidia bacterium]|nr:hypothetical protein [Dehalococcoidia bacterium]
MMKFAAVQMNSNDSVDDNLLLSESLIKQAKEQGADIVLLPENFAFMGYPKQLVEEIMEDFEDGPIQSSISSLARELEIWVIAGSVPIISPTPSRSFARSIVYDQKGKVVDYYDKIHLFDVEVEGKKYNESFSIVPGKQPVTVKTPWCTIGLSICYDVRFPELYRSYSDIGIDVLTIPSAFTEETGLAHWQTLMSSRAIENLSYVVASAQWGKHYGSRRTYGHSMIINAWGEIVDQLDIGDGIVISEIDLEELRSIRQSFPSLKHKVLNND